VGPTREAASTRARRDDATEDGRAGRAEDRPRTLAELVAAHPDATARELRAMLGVKCSESAIYAALKALKLSYKKRRSTPRNRTAPTSSSGAPPGSSRGRGSTRAG